MPKRLTILDSPGFTLIELMISISIIAILTIAAIPSFSDFSKSQNLTQTFKTLKSDLRIAQSHSLSGVTSAGNSKAWGVYLVQDAQTYTIFVCNPASAPTDYANYRYLTALCPASATDRTISLGSQIKILGLSATPLSLVFDSQNGSIYVNGAAPAANTTITLSYNDGSSPMTISISPGGGISD